MQGSKRKRNGTESNEEEPQPLPKRRKRVITEEVGDGDSIEDEPVAKSPAKRAAKSPAKRAAKSPAKQAARRKQVGQVSDDEEEEEAPRRPLKVSFSNYVDS